MLLMPGGRHVICPQHGVDWPHHLPGVPRPRGDGVREFYTIITLSVWARRRGLAYANAQRLAKAGRITGAYKIGSAWVVPADAPVPPKRKPGPKVVTP